MSVFTIYFCHVFVSTHILLRPDTVRFCVFIEILTERLNRFCPFARRVAGVWKNALLFFEFEMHFQLLKLLFSAQNDSGRAATNTTFRNGPLRHWDLSPNTPVDNRRRRTAFVHVRNKRWGGTEERNTNVTSNWFSTVAESPDHCAMSGKRSLSGKTAVVHAQPKYIAADDRNSNVVARPPLLVYRTKSPDDSTLGAIDSIEYCPIIPIIVGRFGRPTVKRFNGGRGRFAVLGGPRRATKKFSGNDDSDRVSEHTFRSSFFGRRRAVQELIEFISSAIFRPGKSTENHSRWKNTKLPESSEISRYRYVRWWPPD